MSALRQKMIEDLRIRNYSPHTIEADVRSVAHFAKHFGQSPDLLTPAHIRDYQLFLIEQRKVSWGTFVQAVCASRETHGYPKDIPLKEAIKIFNEEVFCSGPDPKRPPLTEEEVVAAAIGEITKDGTEPTDPALKVTSSGRKSALEKIWKNRIMPKGSVLIAEGGYDLVDENRPEELNVEVDCWKIYIHIGLDKNPNEGGFLKPDQICLVRKNCFGIKQKTREKPRN